MTRSVRHRAEERLHDDASDDRGRRVGRMGDSPAWAQVYALQGIGWALLDLADAYRGHHRVPPIPPPPPPPPPGVNPARRH